MTMTYNPRRANIYRIAHGIGDTLLALARIKWLSFKWTMNIVVIDTQMMPSAPCDILKELCENFNFINMTFIADRKEDDRKTPQVILDLLQIPNLRVLNYRDMAMIDGLSWILDVDQILPCYLNENWFSVQDLKTNYLIDYDNYICIQPTTRSSKQTDADWPACQDVINELSKEYPVVIIGNDVDKKEADINSQGLDLRGQTKISEAISIVANADFTIGAESWAGLCASLFGKPSITMYRENKLQGNYPLYLYRDELNGCLLPNSSSVRDIMNNFETKAGLLSVKK